MLLSISGLLLLFQPSSGCCGMEGASGLSGDSRGHHCANSQLGSVAASLVSGAMQRMLCGFPRMLLALDMSRIRESVLSPFFSSLFCFSLGLLLTVKLLMQNEGMEISYCSS